MTRVFIRFRLQSSLTGDQLASLSNARGVYGLLGVEIDPAGDRLTLEYDATRLNPSEVLSLLRGAGIPALEE